MITKLLMDSPNHAGVPLVPMGFKGPRDARVESPSHILVTNCSRLNVRNGPIFRCLLQAKTALFLMFIVGQLVVFALRA